uniref:Putative secreted protein n=1 Tax=Anopheles darlingi TaxID=43151 RepID=A0A2M4DKX5_ANODA
MFHTGLIWISTVRPLASRILTRGVSVRIVITSSRSWASALYTMNSTLRPPSVTEIDIFRGSFPKSNWSSPIRKLWSRGLRCTSSSIVFACSCTMSSMLSNSRSA